MPETLGADYVYKVCHTEESSRRQRELEQGLLDAMQKQPYHKITLTDLCRTLDIPRKTFYRYFPTKDDCLLALIDHTLSDCNEIALRGWNGSTELDAKVQLRFFRYWKEQSAFLEAIQNNGFRYLLLERTTEIVNRMKENGESNGFARDQVEYFVAYGLMSTVMRWHHHGFQSSAEEMAEVFGSLLGNRDVSITRLLL